MKYIVLYVIEYNSIICYDIVNKYIFFIILIYLIVIMVCNVMKMLWKNFFKNNILKCVIFGLSKCIFKKFLFEIVLIRWYGEI